MEGFIPGANLKVLGKALQALVKIGDELYIEADKSTLSLTTVNQTKTVYSQITFNSTFFTAYKITQPQNADKIAWKLQIKYILPLFRGANLEKKFEYYKLDYVTDADDMTVTMVYRSTNDSIEQKLRLMDSETLAIGLNGDKSTNELLASSNLVVRTLQMFNMDDVELTLDVSRSRIVARNYCVAGAVKPNTLRIQTDLKLDEFKSCRIGHDARLNFVLRPLRTLATFAEAFNLDVRFKFEPGGRPLILVLSHATFEFSFILATMDPDSDTQGSRTVSEMDRSNLENLEPNLEQNSNDTNRARQVFGRCFDTTYLDSKSSAVLVNNSDSE